MNIHLKNISYSAVIQKEQMFKQEEGGGGKQSKKARWIVKETVVCFGLKPFSFSLLMRKVYTILAY